jgi:hypothetical protein
MGTRSYDRGAGKVHDRRVHHYNVQRAMEQLALHQTQLRCSQTKTLPHISNSRPSTVSIARNSANYLTATSTPSALWAPSDSAKQPCPALAVQTSVIALPTVKTRTGGAKIVHCSTLAGLRAIPTWRRLANRTALLHRGQVFRIFSASARSSETVSVRGHTKMIITSITDTSRRHAMPWSARRRSRKNISHRPQMRSVVRCASPEIR